MLAEFKAWSSPSRSSDINCLCACSPLKFILCCLGINFLCPITKKIKIALPPSKIFFFFFLCEMANVFLPKDKVANRGSTHSVMFSIVRAGDRTTGSQGRCGTENRHSVTSVQCCLRTHLVVLRSYNLFRFLLCSSRMNHPKDTKYY